MKIHADYRDSTDLWRAEGCLSLEPRRPHKLRPPMVAVGIACLFISCDFLARFVWGRKDPQPLNTLQAIELMQDASLPERSRDNVSTVVYQRAVLAIDALAASAANDTGWLQGRNRHRLNTLLRKMKEIEDAR